MPGAIRTLSIPAAMNTGHRMSASWHAVKSSASWSFGAARFAANPSAKWPTNIGPLWAFPGFLIEVVQPLLHERFVEAARLQVLIRVRMGEPGVFGAIMHELAAAMGVEHPLEREKQRRLIVLAILQELLEQANGVDTLAERRVDQCQ